MSQYGTLRKRDIEAAVLAGRSARERLHEKTFRGWANKHLASADLRLDNLIDGLYDGVILVRLVENLTMEPVTGRVKLSPTMDLHRIENVNVALTHLRSYVPALDIDASEIVARNTKLVLGFVWQLIVRFQILAGEAWDPRGGQATVMKKARQKVLAWWREQLAEYSPAIRITESVEESFSDGMAILALLHKLDPNAIDLEEAKRRRKTDGWDGRRANLELAFSQAQEQLRIEPLLDARDMCAEDAMARPDDQCILTYVSEFPPAFAAVYDAAAAAAKRRNEIDRMRAEMEARRAEQERQLEELRRQRAAKAAQSAEERARLQREAEAKAKQLEADFKARQEEELRALAEDLKRQQDVTSEQMELLRQENAQKIAALQKAMLDQADLSRDEQARMEQERAAELARLEEEKALLSQMKDEELRQQKAEMAQLLRDREDELRRELEEQQARERMTGEEYAQWQAQREADMDKMRRERDAMAAAIHAEIARLRAENDQLRRGEPHVLTKRSFGKPTWCHMCRSYIFARAGQQCERTACNYVICNKCVGKHGAPNNCLGDVQRGSVQQDAETLAALERADTVVEGWLQKKGYNTGRWQKRWVVVKTGCLIYYASDKAAEEGVSKRKGLMLLTDVHLVDYTKDKKAMHAFGIESKNACMWLGAADAPDKSMWLEKLDAAIVHTSDAAESEARLEEMFAEAAKKDEQASKLVRLKGGTMLISRDMAAAVTAAALGAPPVGGGAQGGPAGRRHRATARTADYDPTMLPATREVFEAIERQEAKQRADAAAAHSKAVPVPRASAAQLEAGTLKRASGAVSQTSTASPDGKHECGTW